MVVLLIIFIIYSIFTTLYIIYSFFKRERNEKIIKIISNEVNGIGDIEKKISLLTKILEYENKNRPWYENLISTLGVLAFITMLLTTLNQTYESFESQNKLTDLKKNIEKISEKERVFYRYVEHISKYILSRNNALNGLSDDEKRILKIRIQQLLSKKQHNKAIISEVFSAAMQINDFDTVEKIYNENKDDILKGSVSTKLFLSEFYYLKNSRVQANKILGYISKSDVTRNDSLRYFSLKWVLSNKDPKYIVKLSHKIGRNKLESKKMILNYNKKLNRGLLKK